MKRLFVLASLALLLGGCTIPFFGPQRAGLKIIATPQATVMLDGKQVGQTPYEKSDLQAKSYKLQLVPQSGQPWETTVTLQKDLQSVVERIFGETDQESEGYVMELEGISNKSQSHLAVVTIPDPATVRINGQPKGFAPMTVDIPSDTNQDVAISSAGYADKKVSVLVPKGLKLKLTVQLARTKIGESTLEATPSAEPTVTPTPGKGAKKPSPTPTKGLSKTGTPSPTPTGKNGVTGTPAPAPKVTSTPPDRPYVEILDTPTGWLRVRSSPTSSENNEIAKVYPGETYAFLEVNDTGWYKIKLSDGQEGWISGQYAKLFR